MAKRFSIHILLIIVCLIIIFYPKLRQTPEADKAQEAVASTMAFLEQIDARQYDDSWRAAAELLRQKVTQEDWADQLSKTSATTGPVLARSQKTISYSTQAKDSPEGEYIVLVFDTSFQHKERATETVTVMLEEDNVWRVAGYFIQ